jgi:hypothetical protein
MMVRHVGRVSLGGFTKDTLLRYYSEVIYKMTRKRTGNKGISLKNIE